MGEVDPHHWSHARGFDKSLCDGLKETPWSLQWKMELGGGDPNLVEVIDLDPGYFGDKLRRVDVVLPNDRNQQVVFAVGYDPNLLKRSEVHGEHLPIFQATEDLVGKVAGPCVLDLGDWRMSSSRLCVGIGADAKPLWAAPRETVVKTLREKGFEGLKFGGSLPNGRHAPATQKVDHRAAAWAKLSPEARTLFEELDAEGEAILTGPAGSGKTTLLLEILNSHLRDPVILMAPTGRAARRMSEVTGRPARTIHSTIYGRPTEDPETGRLTWPERKPIGTTGGLIVADEFSMIDQETATNVRISRQGGCPILWVGDKQQLGPVNAAIGIDPSNPTVQLTKVWRSGDDIIQFSQAILAAKNGPELSRLIQTAHQRWPKSVFSGGEVNPGVWMGEALKKKLDVALLTISNDARDGLNAAVRAHLGYPGDDIVDGQERLLVRSNNRDLELFNGDLLIYQRCIDHEDVDLPVNLTYSLLYDPTLNREIKAYLDMRSLFQDARAFREARREDSTSWRRKISDRRNNLTTKRWIAQRDLLAQGENLPLWGPAGFTAHVHFGYAFTGHAMQGSEADIIGVVFTEYYRFRTDFEEMKSWWYTVVTRAKKRVVLFIPRA